MLVLAAGAVAGAALAQALGLPSLPAALAGLAAGGAAVGLELAVALRAAEDRPPLPRGGDERLKLLDTSAIVDARIADVAATGFLAGPLLVPRFVLRELQRLADAGDAARRGRG